MRRPGLPDWELIFPVFRIEPPSTHRQHPGSKERHTHCRCHLQQGWGRGLRQSPEGWRSHQSEFLRKTAFLRAAPACWLCSPEPRCTTEPHHQPLQTVLKRMLCFHGALYVVVKSWNFPFGWCWVCCSPSCPFLNYPSSGYIFTTEVWSL